MGGSSTTNFEVPSGSTLPITIGGDGTTINTDVEIKLDPIELKIDPLQADLKIEPLQVSTDSKLSTNSKLSTDSKVATDSKVFSDSKSEIDLKPVAMDSCTTFKLAPLPPVCLEQPYSQHFGITFMGIELWGFNISGKSQTFLHSPSNCEGREIPKSYGCSERNHRPDPPASRPPSGLRVRVK
jgi:hypothetical protein